MDAGGGRKAPKCSFLLQAQFRALPLILRSRQQVLVCQLAIGDVCVCVDAVAMYICTCGKLTCRDLENTTKRLRRIRKLESLSSLQKDDVVADLRRKPIDAVTDRLDTFSSSQKGRSSIARRGFFPTGVREVVMK
jgi:hypothetical protein